MKEESMTETSFTRLAKYNKGKKTLQAIQDAIYELILEGGLTAASQDSIASRAKVTQGAVRHYFPTKDEMLQAFFMSGLERMRFTIEEKMNDPLPDQRDQLQEVVSAHLDSIISTQEVYFFETAAYFARNDDFQEKRRAWYETLDAYFSKLIRQINPHWKKKRAEQATYQVLTLIMGGWITLGESRVLREHQKTAELKQGLVDGVMQLISDDG